MNPRLLVAALLLSSCSSFSTVDHRPIAVQAIRDHVGIEDLRTHMTTLASDSMEGREAGSAGYERAASYVESQYRQLGLETLGRDYRQTIPTRSALLVNGVANARLTSAHGDDELQFDLDFAIGANPRQAEQRFDGEVVFVGYGLDAPEIGRRDYDGVDVRGKIVAMFSGTPVLSDVDPTRRAYYSSSDAKNSAAARHGAIAMITLRKPEEMARIGWPRIAASSKRSVVAFVRPDGTVHSDFPQLAGTVLLSDSGARKLFASSGLAFEAAAAQVDAADFAPRPLNVRMSVERRSQITDGHLQNVVAVLRGSDRALRSEYVVVSAHLDHLGIDSNGADRIYNGFYDNASGVSAVLEIARALTAVKKMLRRSVIFVAFDAEEKGGFGSSYFARFPPVPRENVVADINIDMFLALFPVGDFVSRGHQHSSLNAAVERAARDVGATLASDPEPEEARFIRSDQFSFVKQGIPAVIVKSGFTSADPKIDGAKATKEWLANHYHKPSDDASQPVDWPSVKKITEMNALIAWYVATDAARPRWNEGDFFGERFGKRSGRWKSPSPRGRGVGVRELTHDRSAGGEFVHRAPRSATTIRAVSAAKAPSP